MKIPIYLILVIKIRPETKKEQILSNYFREFLVKKHQVATASVGGRGGYLNDVLLPGVGVGDGVGGAVR